MLLSWVVTVTWNCHPIKIKNTYIVAKPGIKLAYASLRIMVVGRPMRGSKTTEGEGWPWSWLNWEVIWGVLTNSFQLCSRREVWLPYVTWVLTAKPNWSMSSWLGHTKPKSSLSLLSRLIHWYHLCATLKFFCWRQWASPPTLEMCSVPSEFLQDLLKSCPGSSTLTEQIPQRLP